MSTRSWIRNLFTLAPRTVRKDVPRFRPLLDLLEAREMPASFTAANTTQLISAINSSNQLGGSNTITLTAPTSDYAAYSISNFNNTTLGHTGLPVIANGNQLSIIGSGQNISRNIHIDTPFRLFVVSSGATLNLQNLTLSGGYAFGAADAAKGGAIYSAGMLSLQGVTIENNFSEGLNLTADSGDDITTLPSGGGGGTTPPTSFSPVFTDGKGGGIYVAGGKTSITNSTLRFNAASGAQGQGAMPDVTGAGYSGEDGLGGGIYVAAGEVTINGSLFDSNRANGGFGAIVIGGTGGNGGAGIGGGLYLAGGSVNATNSTFTGNSVVGGSGGIGGQAYSDPITGEFFGVGGYGGNGGQSSAGAIFVEDGSLTLTQSTVSGNVAAAAEAKSQVGTLDSLGGTISVGGIPFYSVNGVDGSGAFGGIAILDGSFAVANTIIAGNTREISTSVGSSASVIQTEASDFDNLAGTIIRETPNGTYGNNLFGVVFGNISFNSSYGDIVNPSFLGIAPLANYGGPTKTMALLPGSPAIDAGNNIFATGVTADQRGIGYNRNVGTRVDIGAFEFQPKRPTDLALSNGNVSENQPIGTLVGILSTIDPDVGDSFTYSLVGGSPGSDNSAFRIVGNQLQTAAILDFETQSSYTIRVRTTDMTGLSVEKFFTIRVNDVASVPTDITLSNSKVREQLPAGTNVGSLSTAYSDGSSSFTYSLVSGVGSTDNASFRIVGNELQTAASFNFATKSSYSIRVRSTDAAGLSTDKVFTISVTFINIAPTDIQLSRTSFAETNNSLFNASITAIDSNIASGDTLTFSLPTGVGDNHIFRIRTGNELIPNQTFDYENKSSYNVTIRVTDSGGLTFDKTFTINVTDQNDAPSGMTLSNASVLEKQPIGTVVGTFSTFDQDAGDTFTYSLQNPNNEVLDNSLFKIVGNQLQTAASFDFATKSTYKIRAVTVDSGGKSTNMLFRITVTKANSEPTDVILSNSSVLEKQPIGTVVGTLSTTDLDVGDTFTYSVPFVNAYPDNAFFQAVGDQLQTNASFNYATKSTYKIVVKSTDAGGLSRLKILNINVDELPISSGGGVSNQNPTNITLSATSIAENAGVNAIIGTLTGIDPDTGETLTFSLPSGLGDNAMFNISGNQLRINDSFDFETKSSYSVTVRVTDSYGLTFDKVFTINVLNQNETPTNINLSNLGVFENQSPGALVAMLSTIDPDANNTFTYTLESGTGSTDNAAFTIIGNQLKTAATFDFESKALYSIRVKSTDADGLSTEKAFTILVLGRNERPTDITLSNASIAENAGENAVVGTLTGTDSDIGDTLTYSLPLGFGDNAMFNISGNQLRANSSFDFEAKSSYSVIVRVTDAGVLTFDKTFTINVTSVNETPSDISLSNVSVFENQPAGALVGILSTIDPDANDTFTYTLESGTGSTDNAAFTIIGNQLKTAVGFDFESQATYSIRVKSSDALGLSTEKVFTIFVLGLNESPTDITLSHAEIAENAGANAVIGTLTGSDPDTGDTLTYSLPSGIGDNGMFNIIDNQLWANAGFDYETKSSYSVTVRVLDAGELKFDKVFTINVTNANEGPIDIVLPTASVAENQPAGTTVGIFNTTDLDGNDTFTYTLVSGTGSTDNAAFNIVGNQLKLSNSFDFEAKSSYSIRVRSTDAGGLSTEKVFTITVTNIDEGPTVTVPGTQIAYEDVKKAIRGIQVGDPEKGSLTVTLAVSRGTLTIGTMTGLTVSGNNSASLRISGTIAKLNLALETLVYRGTGNFSGIDTLNLSVTDGQLTTSSNFTIDVISAMTQATNLQSRIEAIRAAGGLNNHQANSLSVKLNLKGNNGDIGRVEAFLIQVAVFRRVGILTPNAATNLNYWGKLLLQSVARR